MTGTTMPSAGFWNEKRVLVTGHTGFKGSWLTTWLTEMGAVAAGLSLPEPPSTPSLWDQVAVDLAADIRGDIRTDGWRTAVQDFGPEVIIHLAAQPLVAEGLARPGATFATNVTGTSNVLEVASQLRSVEALLVATTDKVYDTRAGTPYTEGSPLGGKDPYSASKACAELVVHSWPRLAFPAITARAGNVIGGGDWGLRRLVPDLVRSWASGNVAEIRRPEAVRPWQHVIEPLAGYLVYLERAVGGPEPPRSMNFGPSDMQGVPVRQVVEYAAERWADAFQMETPPSFRVVEDAELVETDDLLIDSARARDELGWSSLLGWRAAVDLTIAWYAAHARNGDTASVLREQIASYADVPVGPNA